MTLFNIAAKNIRRNFYRYFIYFTSMIFSIVIYFTFVSLQYNKQVLEATKDSLKLAVAFKGASIILMIFVGIFIWFSNAFFTRKRKKEVALYSLLGVKKRAIAKMLFYENFVMGILALAIGIFIGTLLSKLFVMLLVKLMGFSMAVAFSFELKAVLNTIFVFAIIILVTSFQGYRLIYRFKLIELFQAEKKSEPVPKASLIVGILGIVFMGFSYWLALHPTIIFRNLVVFAMTILLGAIVGTYLVFHTLTVVVLKRSRNNKHRHYKGINMIGTSQLLYRIRGNARTLTIIAILSAVTLCSIGTSYSLYYSSKENAEHQEPFSYTYLSQGKALDEKVKATISKYDQHHIIGDLQIRYVKVQGNLETFDMLPTEFLADDDQFTLISESQFNKLVALTEIRQQIHLENKHDVLVMDGGYIDLLSGDYTGKKAAFKTTANQIEEIQVIDFEKKYPFSSQFAHFTVVISDSLYDQLAATESETTLTAWKVQNEEQAEKLTKELTNIIPEEAQLSSFYVTYKSYLKPSGLLIFLGGFLGLVFLLATGSIIYFKQLTEATDDKDRYLILRKIGVSKKEIKHSIAKQMLFVFAMPLIIGILHSAVALTALSSLLSQDITIPVVISMGIYSLIYLGYYFLTVNAYNKIVNSLK